MPDSTSTIVECDFTNQVLLSSTAIFLLNPTQILFFFPPLRMFFGQFLCLLDNLLDGTHHVECLLRQCIILSCSR